MRLMEPVYRVELQVSGMDSARSADPSRAKLPACPDHMLGKLYAVLSKRRGTVVREDLRDGNVFVVRSLLPVAESFGFAAGALLCCAALLARSLARARVRGPSHRCLAGAGADADAVRRRAKEDIWSGAAAPGAEPLGVAGTGPFLGTADRGGNGGERAPSVCFAERLRRTGLTRVSRPPAQEFGTVDPAKLPNLARDIIYGVRKRKGLAVKEKVVEHAEKQRTLKRNK